MKPTHEAGGCIAIISPGDMGHAVGQSLIQNGLRVITCLQSRSERTRRLALQAGIEEVDSVSSLVRQADVVLSILVPDHAVDAATHVAHAIKNTGQCPLFADCNAICPQTARSIGDIITTAGGRFADASIIGLPPRTGQITRLYTSGPDAADLRQLQTDTLEVRQVGESLGQASGIKMCYAALTKGTFALQYAMLIAGQRLGLLDELCSELQFSQADQYRLMENHLPRLPAKAFRWIGEMEEVAATFEQLGLPPQFHSAAAEIYRVISRTEAARDTPEAIDTNRTLEQTIGQIASRL